VKLPAYLHLAPRLIHGATPPLPYTFMVWYLVKHRDGFTFFLRPYIFLSTLYETLVISVLPSKRPRCANRQNYLNNLLIFSDLESMCDYVFELNNNEHF
jgi:hypothetical protein